MRLPSPISVAPDPSAPRPSPPPPPGLVVDAEGRGTIAVRAPRAHGIELCVLRDGAEVRAPLQRYDGGWWWDEVEGMAPGTLYGLRAHGPWDPPHGSFANPAKLLVDPRARAVSHSSPLHSGLFAHRVDALMRPFGDGPLEPDPEDNGPDAVWSVVTTEAFDWRGDHPLALPWSDTVIYEAHVRGLTQLHPGLPEELRGTYAGLAHPVMTGYLRELGVTALELLPIHAAMDEPHLARLGLPNYWGYSTLSYFAPNPAYATAAAQAAGGQAVRDEVRAMIRDLHEAGLEVILDVVFNHTAEGGADGPSLSLRGLDAREHYWMSEGSFVDVTGTGGTLDPRSPAVMELVLDSLRAWVTEMHVDGFRFDLAATLGRDDHGFRRDHPLLRAMTTDPVLRRTKLIAEPWDVGTGGWQTGNFPAPFAEWNDAFRNDVRSFWLADPARRSATGDETAGGVRNLATRLAGSADIFTRNEPRHLPPGLHLRAPWASIDYVTSHDGFTLRDLTTYARKHNEANGEDGRDGTDDNRSWNHGHEGELPAQLAADAEGREILAARRRAARSLLATLFLAAGTPMLTAGDEAGRTQRGNNNAYCQDNEISWVSWDRDRHDRHLMRVTAHLAHLRRAWPQLRPGSFLRPADPSALAADQIAWFGAEGEGLQHEDWFEGRRHTLQMLRPGPAGTDHLLVVLNGARHRLRVDLPGAPWPQGEARVLFCSADEPAGEPADERVDDGAGRPCAGPRPPRVLTERGLEVEAGTVVVLSIARDPVSPVHGDPLL